MNPYIENSVLYIRWEHRFERWKYPESEELHVWHCWCSRCDVAKHHVHDGVLVIVEEDGHKESEHGKGAMFQF